MEDKGEHPRIEAVIIEYLEGMIYGQPDRLAKAMHPLCMQAGHYDGTYEFYTRDEFIESLSGLEGIDTDATVSFRILSIDVTGDVAVAKVEDDCFGTRFTDYLTLIKHKGEWQIVMKAFFDHANAT